jgi:TRAP-type C4-dicarboxylate transport system permease small subunit
MRHDADVLSLVFGLLFLGGAGLWAALEVEVLSTDVLPLLLPAALVVIGGIGLATAIRRERVDSGRTLASTQSEDSPFD